MPKEILHNPDSVSTVADNLHSNVFRISSAFVLSIAAAGLVLLTDGNLYVAALAVSVPLLLPLLVQRLELGIFVLLAAAMVIEQFQIFGISRPVTARIPFFLNLSTITGIGPLMMNPVELLIALILGGWLIRAAASGEWHLRPIPHLQISLAFLAMLLFYTGYGLARGGDLKVALWEIRALYYLCAVYFLASQLIRTRKQILICLWIIILGTAIKGLQGCWRFFIDLGGDISKAPAITSHEDALFMVTAFIFMVALFFLGCWRRREFIVLAATFPTTFLTFILTQRRIAYGVLVLSLMIVFALLPKPRKVLALKMAAILLPFFVVYTAVFWNSNSQVALPVRQVRSIFQEGENADTSNTYRKIENFNLEQTIRQYPLGVGFGRKYLILLSLPEIDFPLWEYIPHNCIYWIWAKTGFPGFIIFWVFFGSATIQAVIAYRHEREPFYRAVHLLVITFITSQMAVAYYDLQITFYRNMIYLGTAMALSVAIRHLSPSTADERSDSIPQNHLKKGLRYAGHDNTRTA